MKNVLLSSLKLYTHASRYRFREQKIAVKNFAFPHNRASARPTQYPPNLLCQNAPITLSSVWRDFSDPFPLYLSYIHVEECEVFAPYVPAAARSV